jgi:hypothetical protein
MDDWRELKGAKLSIFVSRLTGQRKAYGTNANIRLPLAEGEEFEIHELWSGKCVARVYQSLSSRVSTMYGEYMEGDTLALARCRAWLAWQDRNK